MGTLYASIRNSKPKCVKRGRCEMRRCPKKCPDFVPDIRGKGGPHA
jgi:hypothetical protein